MRIIISIAIFLTMLMPTPAHAASGRCPQWEPTMKAYGLPVKEFSYIAYRESGCRIKAINATWDKHGNMTWSLNKNGTWDSGLFQVNSGHKETVRKICRGNLTLLLTVPCNFKVAKYLYDRHGLSPWTLHKKTTTVPQVIKVPRGAVIAS